MALLAIGLVHSLVTRVQSGKAEYLIAEDLPQRALQILLRKLLFVRKWSFG